MLVFARTSGPDGKAQGITAFLVDVDVPGLRVPYYHWSFNMPTDHGEVTLDGVHVSDDAVIGEVDRGLDCAQLFVHENRIRQAASSLGAAQFCIDRSIAYARERVIFGKPLADYQGVQWQLVELQTEAELVRNTLYKTAWEMDQAGDGASTSAKTSVSDKVSMVNYRANRLACDAADRAIQVHGGLGYMRALPFEFIYRHHRRYRITEGSDELQLRRIAGRLFGFTGARGRNDRRHSRASDVAAPSRRAESLAAHRRASDLGRSGSAARAATPRSIGARLRRAPGARRPRSSPAAPCRRPRSCESAAAIAQRARAAFAAPAPPPQPRRR